MAQVRTKETQDDDDDDDFLLTSASLRADKEHQVIRLINATDVNVLFIIKTDSNNNGTNRSSKFAINPKEGVIKPRSLTHVRVDNPDLDRYFKLRLIYRRQGLSKSEPLKVKGVVRIALDADTRQRTDGDLHSIHWLIRLSRGILLLILIIYNIILIKYELSR